ncbi:MAG: hypothetical protein HFJ86_00575 [Oscillospiraceae bacterium]|jgi:hypothetical protein|nr:hypothetical protein [Oscillospiraceae bacterium]
MRNIYLIDFENVGSDGLNGVLSLSEEDMVVLFYSVKSDKIAIRTHIQIGKSSAAFEYAEVSVGGKNALDHQLATYLGYLVAKNEAQRYYIVSRDNGYQYIARFWAKKAENSCVECVPTIRSAVHSQEAEQPREKEAAPVERPAEIAPAAVLEENRESARQAAARTPSVEQAAQPKATLISELEKLPLYGVISPVAKAEKKAEPVFVLPEKAEAPSAQEQRTPAPQPQQAERMPAAVPGASAAQPAPQANQVGEAAHPAKGEGQQQNAKPRQERQHKNGPKPKQGKGKAQPGDKQAGEGQAPGKKAGQAQSTQNQATKQGKANQPTRPIKTAAEKGPLTQEEKQRVDRYLTAYPELPIDTIHTLILSGSKQKLCNSLRKNLGQEKGLELYNNIKAIIWK